MKKIILSAFALFTLYSANANNIVVANATLSGQNTTADTEVINFDVTWDNSWRTSTNENNYDGAWIFIKYRKQGTNDWRHCTVTNTGSTPAAGASFSVPADGKGAFIYRSANGIGTVNFTGNQLIWNYGVDGVLDNETVEIRVFALEMVYIPQGSFVLGSGGTEASFFQNGTTGLPYTVASNGAITAGTATGNLNTNGQGIATGTIPASYPKGFNAFWVMKYECSQQQYVDFLNHLDQARAIANTPVAPVYTGTHPNLIAPEPERAQGSLGVNKTAAMSDWSGLRPISELEYEKACRGFNTPAVPNEYAWGNTSITPLTSVNDAGLTNESVNTPVAANANVANGYNVLSRVGIFARPAGSSRTLSGGTYYGVMNMSDNTTEICFSLTANGIIVNEVVHGNGYLDNDGRTDITAWQTFAAFGARGGGYIEGVVRSRVSDRAYASYFFNISPSAENGGFGLRMVRTAQ